MNIRMSWAALGLSLSVCNSALAFDWVSGGGGSGELVVLRGQEVSFRGYGPRARVTELEQWSDPQLIELLRQHRRAVSVTPTQVGFVHRDASIASISLNYSSLALVPPILTHVNAERTEANITYDGQTLLKVFLENEKPISVEIHPVEEFSYYFGGWSRQRRPTHFYDYRVEDFAAQHGTEHFTQPRTATLLRPGFRPGAAQGRAGTIVLEESKIPSAGANFRFHVDFRGSRVDSVEYPSDLTTNPLQRITENLEQYIVRYHPEHRETRRLGNLPIYKVTIDLMAEESEGETPAPGGIPSPTEQDWSDSINLAANEDLRADFYQVNASCLGLACWSTSLKEYRERFAQFGGQTTIRPGAGQCIIEATREGYHAQVTFEDCEDDAFPLKGELYASDQVFYAGMEQPTSLADLDIGSFHMATTYGDPMEVEFSSHGVGQLAGRIHYLGDRRRNGLIAHLAGPANGRELKQFIDGFPTEVVQKALSANSVELPDRPRFAQTDHGRDEIEDWEKVIEEFEGWSFTKIETSMEPHRYVELASDELLAWESTKAFLWVQTFEDGRARITFSGREMDPVKDFLENPANAEFRCGSLADGRQLCQAQFESHLGFKTRFPLVYGNEGDNLSYTTRASIRKVGESMRIQLEAVQCRALHSLTVPIEYSPRNIEYCSMYVLKDGTIVPPSAAP